MIYNSWIKRDELNSISAVSLRNFGIKDKNIIADWEEKYRNDDYYIYNMDKAVSAVKKYLAEGYSFAVMGDYDADGITGSVILSKALHAAGAPPVQIVIPDRIKEGYGAKPLHIDKIQAHDKVCVMFVDNGIACKTALERARKKGFKAVILDHHTASSDDALKLSDVLVDPEAEIQLYGEKYSDFGSYCGAGLAFSFARKLLDDRDMTDMLLCYAAIGTVADVMPLKEENFCIVKQGLLNLADKDICPGGIYALTDELSLYDAVLTAKDLGFSYGPVINAQSRMRGLAGVGDALRLLLADNEGSEEINRAQHLISVNNARKHEQADGTMIAERIITEKKLWDMHPLVVYIPDYNEGIVGIIAGKLSEEYHTPAYVLTDADDPAVLKGSGRSYGNYDMTQGLAAVKPYMISGGGHPGACGLSIKKDHLDDFIKALEDTFPSDYIFNDSDTVKYDLEIDAKDIGRALVCLDQLGPFGEGHPEIVFKINNFHVIPSPEYVNLLSDGSSVRLSGECADAFGFKIADKLPAEIRKADIIGTLSRNYFRGKVSDRIEIIDIRDAEEDRTYENTPLAQRLAEMVHN